MFARRTDYSSLNIAQYSTDSYGAGVNFDFPMAESVRFQLGASAERTRIKEGFGTSTEISDFVSHAGVDFLNLKLSALWMRSTLNHGLFPTAGQRHTLSGLVAVPGSDLEFYRVNYTGDVYYPLPFARRFSAHLRARVGYGGVYGDTTTFPFYEHFYAGGFGSVRGYEQSTLGPRIRDSRYRDGRPFGGNLLVLANAELIFPLPFIDASRGVRSVYFIDAGNVFNTDCPPASFNCHDFDAKEVRVTTGFSISWLSRMGPMTFALTQPLNDKPGDEIERFSFELGQTF